MHTQILRGVNTVSIGSISRENSLSIGLQEDFTQPVSSEFAQLLYCIVYRCLYSASHGINQTEALSVHFSSRKKVRLKATERERETRIGRQRE